MLVYDDTDTTVRHRWWWRYCQQSVDQNRRLAKCWQNSRMWGEGGFCFLALISCYPAPALIVQVQSSASSSSSILWTCSLLLSCTELALCTFHPPPPLEIISVLPWISPIFPLFLPPPHTVIHPNPQAAIPIKPHTDLRLFPVPSTSSPVSPNFKSHFQRKMKTIFIASSSLLLLLFLPSFEANILRVTLLQVEWLQCCLQWCWCWWWWWIKWHLEKGWLVVHESWTMLMVMVVGKQVMVMVWLLVMG